MLCIFPPFLTQTESCLATVSSAGIRKDMTKLVVDACTKDPNVKFTSKVVGGQVEIAWTKTDLVEGNILYAKAKAQTC